MAKSDSEKKKEDWMNSKWRPMMGWMYMGVCFFDFVIAPILWSLTQAMFHGGIATQWQPLTLQGAGLFHISMGAVLGIAAMGRTQEKLAGANNGGAGGAMGTTYQPPSGAGAMGGMSMPSFGGAGNGGFGASTGGASAFGAPQAGGFGSTGAGGFGAAAPTGGFGNPAAGASAFGATDPSAGFGAPIATTASGKKIVPDFNQPLL